MWIRVYLGQWLHVLVHLLLLFDCVSYCCELTAHIVESYGCAIGACSALVAAGDTADSSLMSVKIVLVCFVLLVL